MYNNIYQLSFKYISLDLPGNTKFLHCTSTILLMTIANWIISFYQFIFSLLLSTEVLYIVPITKHFMFFVQKKYSLLKPRIVYFYSSCSINELQTHYYVILTKPRGLLLKQGSQERCVFQTLVSTVLKSWQAVSGIDADDHPEDGERDQSQKVLASMSLFSQI